ncbi:hypothetical protein [Pseudomonas sp. CGJS7]|uniref:hypothetical protein n=1 Tax=Pseudomonas sp. CGJS7 TaxID=3109348 RepID=UPI00300A4199
MNRIKDVALIALAALTVASGTAVSGECGHQRGRAVIAYLGNDAERERDWNYVYGKYSIRNNTSKPLAFPAYTAGAGPVVLHPSIATLQRQSERRWIDAVAIIEHVDPADGVVEIAPGEERVLLASQAQRGAGPYRLRLLDRSGCRVISQPFSFETSQ